MAVVHLVFAVTGWLLLHSNLCSVEYLLVYEVFVDLKDEVYRWLVVSYS
jgi:hypothetical protein